MSIEKNSMLIIGCTIDPDIENKEKTKNLLIKFNNNWDNIAYEYGLSYISSKDDCYIGYMLDNYYAGNDINIEFVIKLQDLLKKFKELFDIDAGLMAIIHEY